MALKILLADDSMTAQNMGKKILVDAGYDVVAVSNGAAAIKKITSERPDIAILDEYMPGYTGSEVCERIKAAVETAKMPVLLTVGKMEPFDPEKANKVHADGVMIKPFEASDLIAAVQSIAQRLLAPAPSARNLDATIQLRSTLGPDETQASRPTDPDHEDTLRLTAQQIKSFQDATYHDWAKTAEAHLEEHEKAAAAAVPEMAVAPAMEIEPTVAIPTAEAAAMRAALGVESQATLRETPVFSAMAASGVAAEHEILTAATKPVAPAYEPTAPVAQPQEPREAVAATPVFYTPPVIAEPEPKIAPIFAVEPVKTAVEPAMNVLEIPTEEASTAAVPAYASQVSQSAAVEPPAVVRPEVAHAAAPIPAAEMPVLEMEPEPAEPIAPEAQVVAPALLEPAVEVAPIVPAAAAPVLETSAPLTPGPMPVAPAAGLEPTSAPAVEIVAATAGELEITSPVQERGAIVAQDPALMTEPEDITQFATRFGVENAEPVHVGLVSDLSDEQLAAIITPAEEAEAEADPYAVLSESQAITPPVTPAVETEQAERPEAEAVTVAPEAPVARVEPIVAYVPEVPSIDDSQAMRAVREPAPEPAPVAQVAGAETAVEIASAVTSPTAEQMPQASVAAPEPEPMIEAAPEPVAATAEAIAVQPVEAAATESAHHEVLHTVEAALAAAAAVAIPSIAHVLHREPQAPETPIIHERGHERGHEPVQEVAEHRTEVESAHPAEPFGDAALAEELAAALSRKETEERAKAAADSATVAAMEQAASQPAAPVMESGVADLTDHKLADAVARAIESLKPQLITEIIKELSR